MRALKEGSHNARILGHLAHGRTLTRLQALRLFDCINLPGRIYDLESRGHNIHREIIRLPSGKKVAQYSLPAAVRQARRAA
jgi:hypothetical protein